MTVLTTELSRLFALPTGIAYDLKTVDKLFGIKKFSSNDDRYFEKVSNVVNGMVIIEDWKDKKASGLGEHLQKRLEAETEIISKIQEKAKNKLSFMPLSFYMKEAYEGSPEVAKLYFEGLLEEQMKYQKMRAARASGIDIAIDKGLIIPLIYKKKNYYVNDPKRCRMKEYFSSRLCEDTPENRQNLMSLIDKKLWGENPNLLYLMKRRR